MDHPFWGAVENLNISGGEPTTRNDLPEMVEMFQRHLPRMRKIGINTTGLTPHRAIPMLTRIVKFCAEQRPADQHPRVARRHRRHPRPGPPRQARLRQGVPDHRGDAGARRGARRTSSSASPRRSSPPTSTDAQNILAWARTKKLDVVFNMLRFTDAMLNNKELEEKIGFHAARRRVHAQVLPRSRAGRVGAERPGVHVPALRRHDRQRLPADDAVPVPDAGPAAQSRTATCTTARTRRSSATCSTTPPKRSTSRPRTSRTAST